MNASLPGVPFALPHVVSIALVRFLVSMRMSVVVFVMTKGIVLGSQASETATEEPTPPSGCWSAS